jgi:phosphoribosylformylglycinamidine cyclo-ligase
MDYRDAGVDVQAGQTFVEQIRKLVERTRRPEVLGDLGGFSGLCQLPATYQDPILVAGTDGVGTKLKLAQALNRHDTIGIDLVAMCVNDVLTSGAEPLFFLDYLATGKLELEQLTQVISGITQGCTEAGCALLGGETAEMPGFYASGEYDLAGFCVGVVEKSRLISPDRVHLGDRVIGLASRGVHSNGFSLVRKIVSDRQVQWSDCPWQTLGSHVGHSATLGDSLLTPTQIYVKPVQVALKAGLDIHGMAHITGGGLPENVPRCLATHQSVQLHLGSWPVPPIFKWLAQTGPVEAEDMYKTFNMGIGFVLLLPPESVESAIAHFQAHGLAAYAIGEVVAGDGAVLGLPESESGQS